MNWEISGRKQSRPNLRLSKIMSGNTEVSHNTSFKVICLFSDILKCHFSNKSLNPYLLSQRDRSSYSDVGYLTPSAGFRIVLV